MPMIDIYAAAGRFANIHKLAADAAAVGRVKPRTSPLPPTQIRSLAERGSGGATPRRRARPSPRAKGARS